MAEGLSGRKYASLVEDNKTAAEADINTAHGNVLAGIYTSATPTLGNLDFGFLRLTVDGKLMTDASISGDMNVDNTSLSTDGYTGKASGTNADFTTAYAAATQILLSSFPSGVTAVNADDVVSIQQVATDGSVTNTYTRDDITLTSDGTTLTVAGATFVGTDTFIVTTNIARPSSGADVDGAAFNDLTDKGQVVMGFYDAGEVGISDAAKGAIAIDDKRHVLVKTDGYDTGTDSIKTFEVSPISERYVVETIVDTTGENTTDDYWYYIDMRGYRTATIHFITTSADGTDTMTLEGSVDPTADGTPLAGPTTGDYADVTFALTGTASYTADEMMILDTPIAFAWLAVKISRAGGTNVGEWAIHVKKQY
jgi:hypothetical protein